MKLPFPIIAGALFAGLTVAADQVTTQNGSILVGKAKSPKMVRCKSPAKPCRPSRSNGLSLNPMPYNRAE